MGDALSTMGEAIESVLASREVQQKVQEAREEQREIGYRVALAKFTCDGKYPIETLGSGFAETLAALRAAFTDATPLGDTITGLRADLTNAARVITELQAELAEVRTGRDALEALDECGVDGLPPCRGKPEEQWCRACLLAEYRRLKVKLNPPSTEWKACPACTRAGVRVPACRECEAL